MPPPGARSDEGNYEHRGSDDGAHERRAPAAAHNHEDEEEREVAGIGTIDHQGRTPDAVDKGPLGDRELGVTIDARACGKESGKVCRHRDVAGAGTRPGQRFVRQAAARSSGEFAHDTQPQNAKVEHNDPRRHQCRVQAHSRCFGHIPNAQPQHQRPSQDRKPRSQHERALKLPSTCANPTNSQKSQ